MKNTKLFIAALGLLVLAACQPSDPKRENVLTPPPPLKPDAKINRPTTEVTANGLVVTYDSRVDILFVIDDSRSMVAHHENLSRNIQQFVDGFAKNNAIDFHIGYVNVWDQRRYGPIVPEVCGQETSTPGFVNWQPAGTLKSFLGDGAPKDGRRYLTPQDKDFATVLKNNLDPKDPAGLNLHMIKDFINPDPKKPSICAQGPEFEESSTPILGALENPVIMNGANKGFRRPGALFVVIVVSDAKDEVLSYDGTPVPDPSVPADFHRDQIKVKDFVARLEKDTESTAIKRRLRIFSVAISPGTRITRADGPGNCKPDPAFDLQGLSSREVKDGENPLVDIAQLTEDANSPKDGQVLSICNPDFGPALLKFGYQIQQDALSDLDLQLEYRPQIFAPTDPDFAKKSLQVFIGDKPLTPGKQWTYNPQTLTVRVKGQSVDWNSYPNQKIRVSFTPVDSSAGTTKPLQ